MDECHIFGKMSQCNTTFDLKINVGHSDLYFTVQRFLLFFALKNILVLFAKPIQANYAVLQQLLFDWSG